MAKAGVQFGKMKDLIKTEGPALVKQVKGVLQFDIKDGDAVKTWTVDLKNGSGDIYEGAAKGKADVTFAMSDDHFVDLLTQKAKAQTLFMGGKLKLKGNMALAMSFEKVLKSMEGKAKL